MLFFLICWHWAKMATSHMYRASCLTLEIKEFRCYEAKIEKKSAVTVSRTEDASGLSRQNKKKVQGSPVLQSSPQFHNPVHNLVHSSVQSPVHIIQSSGFVPTPSLYTWLSYPYTGLIYGHKILIFTWCSCNLYICIPSDDTKSCLDTRTTEITWYLLLTSFTFHNYNNKWVHMNSIAHKINLSKSLVHLTYASSSALKAMNKPSSVKLGGLHVLISMKRVHSTSVQLS